MITLAIAGLLFGFFMGYGYRDNEADPPCQIVCQDQEGGIKRCDAGR